MKYLSLIIINFLIASCSWVDLPQKCASKARYYMDDFREIFQEDRLLPIARLASKREKNFNALQAKLAISQTPDYWENLTAKGQKQYAFEVIELAEQRVIIKQEEVELLIILLHLYSLHVMELKKEFNQLAPIVANGEKCEALDLTPELIGRIIGSYQALTQNRDGITENLQ
ncbi:hypothetical protein QT397_24375 [Microbulbifer sp. MKSA007]|nr:hypothetical protein QT397_24375 [Microbulbifer sp. MKSA007]